MPEEPNGTTTTEVKTPLGSFAFSGKKTAEFIAIISLCLLFVLAYVIYEHKSDAKDVQAQFVVAIKEMTAVAKEGVQVQRVMNCLISTDQKDRQSQIANCERISR